MSRWQLWVLALALFTPLTASAMDPALKCEADKLKAVGKYAYCRLLAESKAARSFDEPDFSKCDAKFLENWSDMEEKAASQSTSCWTTGDAAAIQGSTAAFTESIAESLGVPAY